MHWWPQQGFNGIVRTYDNFSRARSSASARARAQHSVNIFIDPQTRIQPEQAAGTRRYRASCRAPRRSETAEHKAPPRGSVCMVWSSPSSNHASTDPLLVRVQTTHPHPCHSCCFHCGFRACHPRIDGPGRRCRSRSRCWPTRRLPHLSQHPRQHPRSFRERWHLHMASSDRTGLACSATTSHVCMTVPATR